jgi:type II secretory pathway component PulJ
MIWWIVLGAVGLSLVLLALVALPVLRRLPELRRAMARAQRRAGELQGLQASVEAMQERVAEVAARTGEVTVRNVRRR